MMLFADVAFLCHPRGEAAEGLIGNGLHSIGGDVAIIEVEEGADGDGIEDGCVVPPGCVEGGDVFLIDGSDADCDLAREAEDGLVSFREQGRIEIVNRAPDQSLILIEVSSDGGVGLHAELAVVERRGVSRNEFAQGDADGRILMHDLLRETDEGLGDLWPEGEQVPDLPVLGAGGFGRGDEIEVGAGLRIVFDIQAEAGKIEAGWCSWCDLCSACVVIGRDIAGAVIEGEQLLRLKAEGVGDAVEG